MATGNQIISDAQYHFGGVGGSSDTTVSTAMWQQFLNNAVRELYRRLPDEKLARTSLVTGAVTVTVTTGKGSYPASIDRIIRVTDTSDIPLVEVPLDLIKIMDSNAYLVPLHGASYALDRLNKFIFVRPTANVRVVHITPPSTISDFTVEVGTIPTEYHPALALLMAEAAYAQEEDLDAAASFRAKADSYIAEQDTKAHEESEA